MGLKEIYLLLLPITPQSLALSTCKMTLGMPVLMAFYRLRLRLLARGPMGVRRSHSLRLQKPSANCTYLTIIGEKIYFALVFVLTLVRV